MIPGCHCWPNLYWLWKRDTFNKAETVSALYCLSVCLSISKDISGTAGPIFTKFVVLTPCGRGSVFLCRRCDTFCTSGYMDDVLFGRSGLYGDAWLAALILGRSLMSMNALLLVVFCSVH